MDNRANKLDSGPFLFLIFDPMDHLKASQINTATIFRDKKVFFSSQVSINIGLGFQIMDNKGKHFGRIKCLIGNDCTDVKTKLIPNPYKLRDNHLTVYHIGRSGFFYQG